MKKTKIAYLLLSIISFNAVAATWVRCDSCQATDAYAYAQQSRITDEVVVISPANHMAMKFFNEWQVVGKNCSQLRPGAAKLASKAAGDGCSYQFSSTPVALSAAEGGLKDAFEQYYFETNGTMKSVLHVNAGDLNLGTGPITTAEGGSAYDYVNSAFFRARVNTRGYDAINDVTIAASWSNLARAVVGAGAVLALGADGSKITVVINFPDGSVVNLVFTELPTPDSVTAFSAEGMDIIDANNQSQFVGETRFNSDTSLNNFVRTLTNLGVPIVSLVIQPGGTVSCHPIPHGISCIRPH